MQAPSHPNSFYAASANDTRIRPPLKENIKTDICVIGAGYTGMSTALHLAENGYKVTVLEGSRIGFGASGRNGGQIVNSYSRDVDFIEKHYGKHVGAEMGRMAFEGGRILRRFVEQYDIECDLKPGGIFAACNARQFSELQTKRFYGNLTATRTTATGPRSTRHVCRLQTLCRCPAGPYRRSFSPFEPGAGRSGSFRIARRHYLRGAAAISIQEGAKAIVKTESGSVTADYVVVAGNAYLNGLVPKLESKAMPCGTQIITTEPLSEEVQKRLLPKDNCVEDCNYLLDYFRLSGDGRLIYGGGVTYGAREPDKIESLIVPNMLKTYPELKGVKIDYAWTGNFLLTLMRLPQLGRIGSNVFYAQGYSGHGVTCSHLAGKVLSDAIRGQAERFDVFAGLPQYSFPGGRLLRIPFTAMGAWYYNMRDQLGG